MKKLLALLAVLSFASLAQAADGTDFSQSGEFRLQYQHDMDTQFNNNTAVGNSDQWFHQRLKWGLNYRVGEKMSAHLTLVDNANWGENPTQVPGGAGAGNGTTITPTFNPGQTPFTANALNVQEAYGTWQISDSLMMKYGRGSVTMGDGRFVAANDYEFVANAFDGALLHWENEMFAVGLFGVKGGIAATDQTVAQDNIIATFYGVDFGWKTAPDFLKTVNAHYVMLSQDAGDYIATNVPSPQENSSRYGVSVAGDKMGIDYRANYEGYTGTRKGVAMNNQSISASMMEAEVGYTVASLMGLRAHVKYHTDTGSSNNGTVNSGDDDTYQGFYYDRHANNGLMGVLSWGNLTETEIGVSANPRDDIGVALNYQMYSKTNSSDFNYTGTGKVMTDGGGAQGTTVAASNPQHGGSALGSELDLAVTKKYTNNFTIAAHYGMFTPGSVFKSNGATDAMNQWYFESKLTF